MSVETVNILSLILGAIAVISPFILSYFTNKLIQAEDKRAKEMIKEIQKSIDEGNRRHEEMMMETQKMIMEIQRTIEAGNERVEKLIDEGNKRLEIILSEILKRV